MNITTPAKKTKDCFKNIIDYGLKDVLPKNQPARTGDVSVHNFDEESTFKDMAKKLFDSDGVEEIRKHCLTLPMVEEIIKNHESMLDTDGYGNFFFVENEDGSVSVARVYRVVRRWRARVSGLSDGGRWRAGCRLMVCNLETETLSPPDPSSLESRVAVLEAWMKRVQGTN